MCFSEEMKRKENTLQQNWSAYIWLLEDEIEEKRLYLTDHSLNILSVLE